MIEVRSSSGAAFGLYMVFFLVTFLVLAFSSVLITAGGDYGVVSPEMTARLLIVAGLVGLVLIPPFAVLYVSNHRKRWIVSDQGVRIEEDGQMVADWAWDDIATVSLAPNGVTIVRRQGAEKESLLFVTRKQARAMFRVYVAKNVYRVIGTSGRLPPA